MLERQEITPETWPELPYNEWAETCTTLHLFTQIVGKVRLAVEPWWNHSWHATLYTTARGLTTSPLAYKSRVFQIDFQLLDHLLVIHCAEGIQRSIPLAGQSVASFYKGVMAALEDLGMPIKIHGSPNEVPDPIPFAEDTVHMSYKEVYVERFWRLLIQVDRVFKKFRTGYIGKVSPVHLFWGSFDMAVTRFSGGEAPLHPGGIPNLPDDVTREAYSHVVSSAGFWPGGNGFDQPMFYSYAAPTPDGFTDAKVEPAEAYFHKELGEFLLPYEVVRTASDPDAVLLSFLTSTFDAAATTGAWNRNALECDIGEPLVVRPGPWHQR